jgi:hypothetical protein
MPATANATPVPADLYVMLDQTASMSDALGASTRWQQVTSGLQSFALSPPTTVDVGLQYFGLAPTSCPASCSIDADCGACGPCFMGFCTGAAGDSCNASDYATPDVEISPMPSQAGSITSSLAAHSPATSHATSAALQGLVDHMHSWASSHPSRPVGGVLITDGDPTQCDTNAAHVAGIADGGLPVYVLSIGTVSTADAIAAAGGTGASIPILDSAGVVSAMSSASAAVSKCWYQISAGTADGGLVQVRQGGTLLSHVASEAACGSNAGWWYAASDEVVLCPVSCAATGPVTAAVGCP